MHTQCCPQCVTAFCCYPCYAPTIGCAGTISCMTRWTERPKHICPYLSLSPRPTPHLQHTSCLRRTAAATQLIACVVGCLVLAARAARGAGRTPSQLPRASTPAQHGSRDCLNPHKIFTPLPWPIPDTPAAEAFPIPAHSQPARALPTRQQPRSHQLKAANLYRCSKS
jgi:hypothetical protein